MKTVEEYEAEGMFLVMDDTPPEEKVVWTEEELANYDKMLEMLGKKIQTSL